MSTLELKVYDILKSKFTEAEAATVIEYFEAKAKEKIDEKEIGKILEREPELYKKIIAQLI